ncbi:MAG: hypothetical protein RMA76_42215 [Deltaproteobacteria bacterium]|jgi:hypothetical protein
MRFVICLGLALVVSGCILDAEHRCGPNQVLTPDEACVCDDVSIWNSDGTACEPCPFDEVPVGGACACPEGLQRAADGVNCLLAPAPDPVAEAPPAPIENPPPVELARCEVHEDCEDGAYCRPEGEAASCRAIPTGMGETCASHADCAAFEAAYCVPQGDVCLVSGCSSDPDDCPPDWGCCGLSAFGFEDVCVPVGTCPL